ncbi:MAG: hypothetical protein ACKPB9_22265, partial [Dolichospermum sp.]
ASETREPAAPAAATTIRTGTGIIIFLLVVSRECFCFHDAILTHGSSDFRGYFGRIFRIYRIFRIFRTHYLSVTIWADRNRGCGESHLAEFGINLK